MREDEHFGHFVPLLRRIIILAAVITAIPVVLWTITAFVRAYVGPPKIPTFHQLAAKASIHEPPSAETQDTTDKQIAAAKPAKLADASAEPLTTDMRDAPAPKGPFLGERAPDTDTAAPPGVPAATPPVLGTAVTITPKMAATPSAQPTDSKPADVPAPPVAAAPGILDTATPKVVVAAQEPAAATEPAPDAVPAGTPLAGRVPLPRKRHVIADAQPEPATPTGTTPTGTMTHVAAVGPIPMPRRRPDAAGPGAPPPDTASGGPLDFITNIFGGSK
jgi:hypothetical protein